MSRLQRMVAVRLLIVTLILMAFVFLFSVRYFSEPAKESNAPRVSSVTEEQFAAYFASLPPDARFAIPAEQIRALDHHREEIKDLYLSIVELNRPEVAEEELSRLNGKVIRQLELFNERSRGFITSGNDWIGRIEFDQKSGQAVLRFIAAPSEIEALLRRGDTEGALTRMKPEDKCCVVRLLCSLDQVRNAGVVENDVVRFSFKTKGTPFTMGIVTTWRIELITIEKVAFSP